MKEYIEREKLKLAFLEDLHNLQSVDEHTANIMLMDVDEAPTADVVEVRHGRWIPEACESVSKRNRLIEYRVYSCSICGRSNGRVKKKYCPNCGARMEKEDEHEAG